MTDHRIKNNPLSSLYYSSWI